LNTRPKELSTATLQMSAQPAIPQGHYYMYKIYALYQPFTHLPKKDCGKFREWEFCPSLIHLSLVPQPPPSSTMPMHPHLIPTFASSMLPPIMPTTHHVGRPPPSHDDQRGNAMHESNNRPHRRKAMMTGTRVAMLQSATWLPDDGQRRGQSPLPLTVC